MVYRGPDSELLPVVSGVRCAAVHTCCEEEPHPAIKQARSRSVVFEAVLEPANNCSSDCSNIRMASYGKTRVFERVLGGNYCRPKVLCSVLRNPWAGQRTYKTQVSETALQV